MPSDAIEFFLLLPRDLLCFAGINQEDPMDLEGASTELSKLLDEVSICMYSSVVW